MQLKLAALVLGDGSTLTVELDSEDDVDELRARIHQQLKCSAFPSAGLSLFSTQGLVGRNADAAAEEKHNGDDDAEWPRADDSIVRVLGERAAPLQQLLDSDRELSPGVRLSSYFGSTVAEAPPPEQICVLVVLPEQEVPHETPQRNPMLEKDEAPWVRAIRERQLEDFPADLPAFLRQELTTKIPLDDCLWEAIEAGCASVIAQRVVAKLFKRESTGEPCAHHVLRPFILREHPVTSSSPTESTYHHLWDSLIAVFLCSVCYGSHYNRYPRFQTASGSARPDMCLYIVDNCVFRGHEAAYGSTDAPARELWANLTWSYGDSVPYVLGYAATGTHVSLVKISRDTSGSSGEHAATGEVLAEFALQSLHGRLSLLLALLNVSRLLTLTSGRMKYLCAREFADIRQTSGVLISRGYTGVWKQFPPELKDARIAHSQMIFDVLQQHNVPNTVCATEFDAMRGYVVFEPCGVDAPPRTLQELLIALRDVLTALATLHAAGIAHRSICWDNVLKVTTADSWFLIGFDAAARSHDTSVDMRGVGRLIITTRLRVDVPSELSELQQRIQGSDPEMCLRAVEALATVENLLASETKGAESLEP
ncbi:hypothetical protein PybrP1_005495 [[Pythium] brassicae (nom. inval.)]|nr:hypothetical protein PybrP1_005495 [[Pythium] brassicae (nom. inval.)]